jgi:hypothetical protein
MIEPVVPNAEPWLHESINWRTVVSLWFQAAIVSVTMFLLALPLAAFITRSLADSLMFGLFTGGVTFWLVLLLATRHEQIGEWRVLLTDRASHTSSVYSHIVGRLHDRRMPLYAQIRRTPTGLNTVGNRLVMIDGHNRIYIAVFEYGTSLYLGWMMWRSRRGLTLVGRFIADLATGMTGRTDPIGLTLRDERARALREAAHSLCREGMYIATNGIVVPEAYGFPHGLPPIEPMPPGSGRP